MSDRPFMQIFVGDYVAETPHLSCEQHGAYLLLQFAMWNADGALPNDDVKLARIVRLSLKKWRAIKDDVLAFFEVSDSQITHKKLVDALQKVIAQSEKRAAAGAKGGRANALKNNNPTPANAQANDEASLKQGHNQNQNHKEHTTLRGTRARANVNTESRIRSALAEIIGEEAASHPSLIDFSEPRHWIEQGCDVDGLVIPVIKSKAKSVMEREGKIHSWQYFTEKVLELHREMETYNGANEA